MFAAACGGEAGTGLGLAIIQDVVGIYDGTLQIENAQPKGLRVELLLPISATYSNK